LEAAASVIVIAAAERTAAEQAWLGLVKGVKDTLDKGRFQRKAASSVK
jgi:hypothetical protein